jgi:uncharacterized protein GlcG (DUF336 family)
VKIRFDLLSLCFGAASVGMAQVPSAAPKWPSANDPAARGPSVALAVEAAQAAVATCNAQGAHIGVSVVDSAGVLKAMIADDGANKRSVMTSLAKAMAANDFKMPSSELAEKIKTDAALAERVKSNTSYDAGAGALPMMVNGEVIGAIGVGGARGSRSQDEDCARAGLEKVRARLK